MVRLISVLFIFCILVCCHVGTSESRKLSSVEIKGEFDDSVLSRGPPPSVPSENVHANAMAGNERLFLGHLAGIDRILQSVPSPGVGH
ncbi:hypothetical protein Pint_04770 [Pistacia integerrima]|uniref:Uncharacterized protein n=2 Tax=Pistacia TaxID=55512 RepID=A0ACC1BTG1_9ROSI|nr:hypothetical protein Pint_04770 [Pistacia integerrima]KAJ0102254.1 hypothetical protein Patl1_04877 [Pistacia atlantica]